MCGQALYELSLCDKCPLLNFPSIFNELVPLPSNCLYIRQAFSSLLTPLDFPAALLIITSSSRSTSVVCFCTIGNPHRKKSHAYRNFTLIASFCRRRCCCCCCCFLGKDSQFVTGRREFPGWRQGTLFAPAGCPRRVDDVSFLTK